MSAQLPIPRATLEEMERNRERALALYAESFDTLERARDFAALAAISGKTSERGQVPGQFTDAARDAVAPRYHGAHVEERRTRFIAEMTQQTDRAMWSHIIRATDLERLMDKEARESFRDALEKEPPPAIADNVRSTLSAFMEDADTIFKRGIANAFSSLDRRFKSHDGFKVGARIILPYMFNASGGWNYHARQDETLRDIERTFCVLDGKPHPERGAGICGEVDAQGYFATQWTIEGAYFRIRRFKNGNAHLWFTRPDLVRRVNRLLADYYGEVIGESSEVADTSDMGPGYHLTPARNFGFFETDEATAARLFERLSIKPGDRVLEPSAGGGALANIARKLGAAVKCVEIDSRRAALLADIHGHSVRCADFLQLRPGDLEGLFDVIVMNPPFDRGRDCDHVRHALQFLKPGGRLVAIMSAGTVFREDHRTTAFRALLDKVAEPDRWERDRFHDLPAGSFAHAGTMVNTVTLAITKRKTA